MKLWQKKNNLNKKVEQFTVGNDYLLDQKLVKHDCIASIAHAKMLKKIGIISNVQCDKIIQELNLIIKLDKKGKFIIKKDHEDCHTAIECFLVKKLSETGKMIHTGRSRNDQVLTALRLYYKEEINSTIKLIDILSKVLKSLKNKYGYVETPGYTHMRKAMPSSIGLWADAFIESMKDNKKLLLDVYSIIDQSPLGTGAGYGLPIEIDREITKELLGFKKTQSNPIYVQNSRGKFESSILHALNQIMLDLNKISSDLILFSMSEFGFFELPSEICTGSSIMPHKKNPDILELIRAKYHTLLGYEIQVKTIISNLISGYNRDLQLTKKPVMNGFEITEECLEAMILVLNCLKVNTDNCNTGLTDELYSTEKVYNLVKKSVPFREAYRKISE